MKVELIVATAFMILFTGGCTVEEHSTAKPIRWVEAGFTSKADKLLRLTTRVVEGWTYEVTDMGISLNHPGSASLGLMLVESLPKADYDDLVTNRQEFRDLTKKKGNPSTNRVSGFQVELYEFKAPAGEGYLMITHPPDNVSNNRRGLSGNTFGDPLVLVTGHYEKDDEAARKDIEMMLDTIRVRQTR